ncbi:hypothetical protein SEPCBS119000_001772 [Sporothrix epigloea]|uniref:Chromo domain-containing protein n=1 Tax=Sporothrix epigloea TaxID=1892477 RepID=A0ABP0DDS1_9PEZI
MARTSVAALAVSGNDAEPKAELSVDVATDDMDDSISISSTPYASDDSQKEYLVEDILAQDDTDGDLKYLVQWTGYPLEECTWELGENMDAGLLRDLWDDKIEKKDYRPFDLTLFYDAIAQKQRRHFRRNLMRKERGLPQTYPFENENGLATTGDPVQEATAVAEGKAAKTGRDTALSTTEPAGAHVDGVDPIDHTQDTDEDVVVLDILSTPATAKIKKEEKTKQKPVQTKGKKKEAPRPASEKRGSAEATTSRSANKVPTQTTASSVTGRAADHEPKSSASTARKARLVESPSAPQNNAVVSRPLAGLPSPKGAVHAAPKTPVKASSASKKAGTSTPDADAHSPKLFSARKTSKITQITQQTGNAFNSGKKIRVRPNLVTAMADPSRPQQLITSRRHLRIAEQQEREKNDAAIEPSKLTSHLFPISAGPPAMASSLAKTANQQNSLSKPIIATGKSKPVPQELKRKKSVHFSEVLDGDESVVTRVRLISPPYEGSASSDDDGMAMHQESMGFRSQMPDRAVQLVIGSKAAPLDVISSATAHEVGVQEVLEEVFENNVLHLDYTCLADTLLHQLDGEGERVHLMRKLTNLDRDSYEQLFPRAYSDKQRTVFLVFPPSSSAFAQQLAFWIRDVDNTCAVHYCMTPGAWTGFWEKAVSGLEHAAVIIHEQVVSAIRRFPGFNNLVVAECGTCKIWSISQSILSPPLYPSLEPYGDRELSDNVLADVGQIKWSQLFPNGVAIFITPSFILSDPQRTHTLLQWVLKARQDGDLLVTLVTAWDICGYLLELADEKFKHYEALQADRSFASKQMRKAETDRLGIGVRKCYLRYETHMLACELCDMQETAHSRAIEFADEAIDGNDEQSLVNWFGWWASLHFDRYRFFHVVGSDAAGSRSFGSHSRKIRMPSFTPGTTADPEVAWSRKQSGRDQLSQMDGLDQHARQDVTSPTSSNPPSRYFPDASVGDFTYLFMEYARPKTPLQLYRYAIYWTRADEVSKKPHLARHSIEKWFSFAYAFGRVNARPYIGFFNMPSDSSSRGHDTAGSRVATQPFVALYRPMNATSNKTNKTTELIFWDCRAHRKFQGQTMLYRSDLTSAQLAVVDYILEYGYEKHDMNLGRVYIGGEPFKATTPTEFPSALARHFSSLDPHHQAAPTGNDIDATIEFMDEMTSDFSHAFPVSQKQLEARNFLWVHLSKDRPPNQPLITRQTSLKEKKDSTDLKLGNDQGSHSESAETVVDENAKIVFHPPRGDRTRRGKPSLCSNRFFESVRLARLQRPEEDTMDFDFMPTGEWYGRQVIEGRGYEHLHVNSGKSFFTFAGFEP